MDAELADRLHQGAHSADPERAEAALFADRSEQPLLNTLIAFNHELARARESVSEPTLGAIRLQFWRDVLEEAKRGATRRHDVAEGLAACVETKPEIAPIVRDMLDARDADMEERPFTDEAAFRSYLDATAGGLIRASWALLGHRDDEAARVLGEAWGRVGLLRALPVHARSRRLMMPEEVVNAHGGDAEALFSARWGEAERAALADLHAKAVTTWRQARRVFPTVPTHARPAVLYVALVPGLLKGLSDPSPRAVVTTQPGPRRLRMMWAALRGRV